jgi:hypothetical protein
VLEDEKSYQFVMNFSASTKRDVLLGTIDAECVEEFAKYQELGGRPERGALLREKFAKGGSQEFMRTMTGDGRLPNSPAYNAAPCYVALGEKDKAFAELNSLMRIARRVLVRSK